MLGPGASLSHEENKKLKEEEHKKRVIAPRFRAGTEKEKIVSTFKTSLKKKVFNVDVSQIQILNLNPAHKTHLNREDIWNLFHDRGKVLPHKELEEVMNHFDFDIDGKIHYLEFMYELLDLPLPSSIRGSLPAPRRGIGTDKHRPPLGRITSQCIRDLKVEACRSATRDSALTMLFTQFDKDGSGRIAYDEMTAMSKAFNCEVAGGDAASILLDHMDKSGDGALSYEEFVKDVLGVKPAGPAPEVGPRVPAREGGMSAVKDQLSTVMKRRLCQSHKAKARAFNLFDRDRGGSCSFGEFRDGVKSIGIPVTNAQVRKLWKQFQLNPDDTISYEAFFKMVLEESFAEKMTADHFKTMNRSDAKKKKRASRSTPEPDGYDGTDELERGMQGTRMVMGRPALLGYREE